MNEFYTTVLFPTKPGFKTWVIVINSYFHFYICLTTEVQEHIKINQHEDDALYIVHYSLTTKHRAI